MRKRRAATVGLVLLVLGALAWYIGTRGGKDLETARGVRELTRDLDVKAEVEVDLSLSGIELTHGEAGQRQWRMTAEHAKYLQDQGVVEVERPRIRYFLAPEPGPDAEMLVEADKGRVQQEEQQARLWSNVVATYGKSVITARELLYDGKKRRLTMQGGTTLKHPSVFCEAPLMTLRLESRELVARGGVNATFHFSPSAGQEERSP